MSLTSFMTSWWGPRKTLDNAIVVVPCFKRPEYTLKCVKALESAQSYKDVLFYLVDDGSCDGTKEILESAQLHKRVVVNESSSGLRNVLLDFFNEAKKFQYMVKIDND